MLFDHLVQLPLGVLSAQPIDQILDLILQTAVVHVSGDAGSQFMHDVVEVFSDQSGSVSPVGQAWGMSLP